MVRNSRLAVWLCAGALAGLVCACVPVPIPVPVAARPPEPVHVAGVKSALSPGEERAILGLHNAYRAAVGESALAWSDDLAASAQDWANHLAADVHGLKHSGEAGMGENLAMWTAGRASLEKLVRLWGEEKADFVDSPFPHVSRKGNWKTVAHYTQIIWRNTTEVGCGFATGGGEEFLVCHYAPQGNFMGERAL